MGKMHLSPIGSEIDQCSVYFLSGGGSGRMLAVL